MARNALPVPRTRLSFFFSRSLSSFLSLSSSLSLMLSFVSSARFWRGKSKFNHFTGQTVGVVVRYRFHFLPPQKKSLPNHSVSNFFCCRSSLQHTLTISCHADTSSPGPGRWNWLNSVKILWLVSKEKPPPPPPALRVRFNNSAVAGGRKR